MKSFRQPVDSLPSIRPTGFAGFSIQNSNVVIDKTYSERGTSFVNVYQNSNVVLKDCATPAPTEVSDQISFSVINTRLIEEVRTSSAPSVGSL